MILAQLAPDSSAQLVQKYLKPHLQAYLQPYLQSYSQPHLQSSQEEAKLCFGIKELDELFNGGVTFGTLLEMGIPFGNGGRRLLVHFIAAATSGISGNQRHWCLWISARAQPSVYPPAWQALGVDLLRLRFALSASPVADLKAALLSDLFRIVVIDNPARLKPDEHVFLAQCARRYKKIIVVVRDGLLSPRDSNTAAKYRLNISKPMDQNVLDISPIRGLHRSVQLSSFFQHPDFRLKL